MYLGRLYCWWAIGEGALWQMAAVAKVGLWMPAVVMSLLLGLVDVNRVSKPRVAQCQVNNTFSHHRLQSSLLPFMFIFSKVWSTFKDAGVSRMGTSWCACRGGGDFRWCFATLDLPPATP